MTTLLVTGSRNYCGDLAPYCDLLAQLNGQLFSDAPITLIHGGAAGADTIAGKEGHQRGWTVNSFPAEWGKYGKKAGPMRNTSLVQHCPHLALAVLTSTSVGTRDCLRKLAASTNKVECRLAYVLLVDGDNGGARWLTPTELYQEFG